MLLDHDIALVSLRCGNAVYVVEEASTFDIQVRELISAVFAAAVWSHHWSNSALHPSHVEFQIDNMSAVCWANKKSSRHELGQLLLHILSLLEVRNNFYTLATHVPDSSNCFADASSRVWQSTAHAARFADV